MIEKTRICAITTISKTMDWFIVDSMRNLAVNGYDVTLVCNMDEKFIADNSDYATCIPVYMSRGATVKDLFCSTIKLLKIFKREKFDIIYYTSPNAAMYASCAGMLAGIKLRVYSQCGLRYVSFNGMKRHIFKFVEKLTCGLSTQIRAQSPQNMEFAIREKLCKRNKISVVGIGGTTGVDLKLCDNFDHINVRNELRNKYDIPDDAFVYGYVGRINRDKGINELISAFYSLKDEIEQAYLVLVGMIDDKNPINSENLARANECDRIILTGNVPKEDVYWYMSMFDVLTHPTYREGFGKALQEAMGMSLPIITTNVPGPSEVVENGVSGILCEAGNSEDLSDKMQLLYCNGELRSKIAEAGRKRAERYFDRPIMLNNILSDITNICGKE